MVRVEMNRWGQTVEDLRHLPLQTPHRRTHERFLALIQIAGLPHGWRSPGY